MKLIALSMLALASGSLLACGSYQNSGLHRLAVQAISENAVIAAGARSALREQGQAGVDAMLAAHRGVLLERNAPGTTLAPQSAASAPGGASLFDRVREALDEIGQQRDCHASGLYWHTDLEKAKAAAREKGKPILSLRLLGNLSDEFSCANSRFFRTTLYANAEVSKFLRDNFVLHWQSVRPAPRVTIDFGDGRKVERTVTGNSIHYILDASGHPIDALPGLYGPKAFMAGLEGAGQTAQELIALQQPERDQALRRYHASRLEAIVRQWSEDLAKVGAAVEAASSSGATLAVWRQLREASNDTLWPRIAALHAKDTALDESSRKLIAQKRPSAWQAGRLAMSKAVVEDPMLRLLRNLERSIAEDTVRNEYVLHAQLHQWLADGTSLAIDPLNAKVYAELFLTPGNDPWLGLASGDGYTALEDDGIVASLRR